MDSGAQGTLLMAQGSENGSASLPGILGVLVARHAAWGPGANLNICVTCYIAQGCRCVVGR